MSGAKGFYVTVIRNPGPRQKVGVLLGPENTKAAAEALVATGRRLASAVDPWTAFDSFGVTRAVMPAGRELPVGKLNGLLEKEMAHGAEDTRRAG